MKEGRLGIIIQVRMTSTRLPGKVLKPLYDDKPMLFFELERLLTLKNCDTIIVATTINATDNPVLELCKKMNVPVFRGSEDDVLSRYYGAAVEHKLDHIVRITGDCPLIDPKVTGDMIDFYRQSDFDYVSNFYPRTFPRGMDTEVFTFAALKEAHEKAKSSREREHVTVYLREGSFRKGNFAQKGDDHEYRLTVDNQEDLIVAQKLYEALHVENPLFGYKDSVGFLDAHPDIRKINNHLETEEVARR
jgi:spore coat polysaccharide biosynthesis protein SpsF